MTLYLIAIAAAVGVVRASTAAAQQPAAATSEHVRPYSRVTSIRELPDGRVLVSDAGQSRIELLTSTLTRATPVTTRGTGPTEYQSADLLLAAPGDSTLLVDLESASLLAIDPSGMPVRKIPVPKVTSGGRTFSPEIRGSDAAGRFYFTGNRRAATPGAARDSAPIVRWTPTTDAIDTLTWIRIPVVGLRPSETDPTRMLNTRPDPFEWRDTWTVTPVGRVAVVRGDDYHVELVEGARLVIAGPRVGALRVPVSDADVASLRADSITITTPTGTRTVSSATGAILSASKPYVVTDAPPRIDSGGRLWVERSRSSDSEVVTYDVFDASARPTLTVTLRNTARIVGFGDGTVYVTHPAEGGQYRVSRGRLPRR